MTGPDAAGEEWPVLPEAALFDVARPRLPLTQRRQTLRDVGDLPLWPAVFELADAQFLPETGLVAAGGRLLAWGLATNLAALRTGYHGQARPAEAAGTYRIPPPSEVVEEPVALVGGDASGNYYHWLFDALPRAAALLRHRDRLAGGAPPRFAVTAPRPAFADELLRLAGLAEVLDVPVTSSPLFRRLFVVSNFTQFGFVHPVTFQYLPGPPPPPPRGRRLYVSRGDAATRRLGNEAAVLAALAPLGVEPVSLSGWTLAAQRALFASAELIVGPHGAGLSNILWAPAGCAMLELRPEVNALWQFERLCAVARRPYAVVTAPPRLCRHPGWANTDFALDPATVAEAAAVLLTHTDEPLA